MDPHCPICEATDTSLVVPSFEGYVSGWTTEIRECPNCETSYSTNRNVPAGLYEAIYRQASRIAGYDRYSSFPGLVRASSDPLTLLSSREDIYRGLADALTRLGDKHRDHIVDYGCGIGYVTFALRRAGWDCVGVDISDEALGQARTAFPEDRFLSLEDADLSDARFIACLELVEHLADPIRWLVDIRRRIGADTSLVVSTPNKRVWPSSARWAVELPPVHLFWFTRRGLETLARRAGFTCDFVDLGDRGDSKPRPAEQVFPLPVLSRELRLNPNPLSRRLRRLVARSLQAAAVSLDSPRHRSLPAGTVANPPIEASPSLVCVMTPTKGR